MPTYEQYIAGAERARAAGMEDDALELERRAAAARPGASGHDGDIPPGFVLNPATGQMEDVTSPNNPNVARGRLAAAGQGLGQGLGMGTLDEVVGALYGLTGPGTFGENYNYATANMRAGLDTAREDYPATTTGSEIAGALGSSLSGWGALGVNPTGGNLAKTTLRGAGMGGVEGALYGAGTQDQDRLGGAISGAGYGSAFGAAAPAIVSGASSGGRAVIDALGGGIDSMLGRASGSRANRALAQTLERAGKTPQQLSDDIAAAVSAGQPEYRAMDALGLPGQRRASGIIRAGGDGATEIADFLQQRQIDQPDRVASFVEDAFGFRGKPKAATGTDIVPEGYKFVDTMPDALARPTRSAAEMGDRLTTARGDAANSAYAAAREGAGPVDVRGAVGVIDNRIAGMQGSGVAGDAIDNRLARYRGRLTAPSDKLPEGVSSMDLSDFDRVLGVKRDLQDDIGAAVRSGRNNEARELGKIVSELDAALEAASTGYRTANDDFARNSRVIDALNSGADMSRPGARAADTVPAFKAMTPDERSAARIGYGDRALAKIEAIAAPSANRAKVFGSTKASKEAEAMALDPQMFADRLARENTMWETMNRALGGSRTADNLADQGDLGVAADLGRAAKDAMFGRVGSALSNVGSAIGPRLTGQNDATRALIAKALMSSDPVAAFGPAVMQRATDQERRRVIEALMRATERNVQF